MTTATERKLMTGEELLLMPKIDGRRFELIRGVLIEKMPTGDPHGEALNSNLTGYALTHYARSNRYGVVRSGDPGYRLEREPDTVRAPDVAWFAPGRLQRGVRGYPEIAPDLAIEIKSPSNSWPEMSAKAQMWLCYGSRAGLGRRPPNRYRQDIPAQCRPGHIERGRHPRRRRPAPRVFSRGQRPVPVGRVAAILPDSRRHRSSFKSLTTGS